MSLSPVARSSTFTQSLLLSAVGVTALGQTLGSTLLPSLGRATGLAEIQVGLIISCSSLAFALASPVWGYLSELYGRRPILIIGLSGYATGTLLFALVFQAGLAGWGWQASGRSRSCQRTLLRSGGGRNVLLLGVACD